MHSTAQFHDALRQLLRRRRLPSADAEVCARPPSGERCDNTSAAWTRAAPCTLQSSRLAREWPVAGRGPRQPEHPAQTVCSRGHTHRAPVLQALGGALSPPSLAPPVAKRINIPV